MVASVAFNPFVTTNAAGLFLTQADGLWVGSFMDDPAIRNELAGGVLASTETLPMFQGVGIYEQISATGIDVRGNVVGRATSQGSTTTGLIGFTVANQQANGLTSPQSPVPQLASGMGVNFFRLGSGARIVVAIDPAIVSGALGALVTKQYSWDYTNQRIVAYDSVAALPVKILQVQAPARTISYNSGTGAATWVDTGNACALIQI